VRNAAARETVLASRASEVLASGLLGRRLGSRADLPLFEALCSHRDPLMRAAGAIARVYVAPLDDPEPIVGALTGAASLADHPDEDLPFCGGHVAHLAAIALAEIGRRDRRLALEKLRTMTDIRAAAMPPRPWTPSPADEMLARMSGEPLVPQPPASAAPSD
jgi:hypothetical protein